MLGKQAIIAGLLAGSAAIGAIAYTQRSPETAETAALDGSAAGSDSAVRFDAPVAAPVGQEVETLLARLGESQDENVSLREDLAGRDALIADLLARIKEREASIAALEAELAGRPGGDLSAAVAERDARITELTALLAERSATIERTRREMEAMAGSADLAAADRSARIEALTATITERDSTIAALQAEIEALGTGADLGPMLAERDTRIETLAAELAARETALTGLESELDALRDEGRALTERDSRIADLTASLAEREVAGNALRAELEALRGGADPGPVLATQEAAVERHVADLTAQVAARDATIARLQADIAALRDGPDLAPTLVSGTDDAGKPLLAFADRAGEAARLDAMLDAIKLGPAITVPVALSAPGVSRPSVDATPALAEVHFEIGSARLTPGALARAAAAVVVLGDMPITRIRVIGFADRTGSAALNQRLAEARARAVAAFLIANGLSPEVIETAGVIDASELPVETGPGVTEPLNRSVAILPLAVPTG